MLITYSHGPCCRFRGERRRQENILRKVLIQRNCTRIVLPASTIARAEICLGCWRDCPFLNPSTRLFRWEGSRQHDRTPTKIASAFGEFPWPDLARLFLFLRSWHDPAEIRTTRTTTYQTWSKRSNHFFIITFVKPSQLKKIPKRQIYFRNNIL